MCKLIFNFCLHVRIDLSLQFSQLDDQLPREEELSNLNSRTKAYLRFVRKRQTSSLSLRSGCSYPERIRVWFAMSKSIWKAEERSPLRDTLNITRNGILNVRWKSARCGRHYVWIALLLFARRDSSGRTAARAGVGRITLRNTNATSAKGKRQARSAATIVAMNDYQHVSDKLSRSTMYRCLYQDDGGLSRLIFHTSFIHLR